SSDVFSSDLEPSRPKVNSILFRYSHGLSAPIASLTTPVSKPCRLRKRLTSFVLYCSWFPSDQCCQTHPPHSSKGGQAGSILWGLEFRVSSGSARAFLRFGFDTVSCAASPPRL